MKSRRYTVPAKNVGRLNRRKSTTVVATSIGVPVEWPTARRAERRSSTRGARSRARGSRSTSPSTGASGAPGSVLTESPEVEPEEVSTSSERSAYRGRGSSRTRAACGRTPLDASPTTSSSSRPLRSRARARPSSRTRGRPFGNWHRTVERTGREPAHLGIGVVEQGDEVGTIAVPRSPSVSFARTRAAMVGEVPSTSNAVTIRERTSSRASQGARVEEDRPVEVELLAERAVGGLLARAVRLPRDSPSLAPGPPGAMLSTTKATSETKKNVGTRRATRFRR